MVLGVHKEERDYIGGFSAQGSDKFSRVAIRVISNLHRVVMKPLIDKQSEGSLAEDETSIQFRIIFARKVSHQGNELCFRLLGKAILSLSSIRHKQLVAVEAEPLPTDVFIVEPTPPVEATHSKTDKRLKSESIGISTLPKKAPNGRKSKSGRWLPRVSASGRNREELTISSKIATWCQGSIIFNLWANSCHQPNRWSLQALCKEGIDTSPRNPCTEA